MQTTVKPSGSSPILVEAPRIRERGEDLARTTLNVPSKTLDRFENCTKGGKGMCLAALLEYAMDKLQESGEVLVVKGE